VRLGIDPKRGDQVILPASPHSPDYLKLKKQCSPYGLAELSGNLENALF
jgi:hypothetical protein